MTSPFRNEVHAFLRDAVLTKSEIERFVDPNSEKWAQFDAELGYVPHASKVPDGIDGAISTYRYGSFGERVLVNYGGERVRINAYGDSMTQCHQVSDGETWEETLAAHLGEPIRNFGVGGYGVYQARRRLARVESNLDAEAEYVMFNIFLDDHYRSLDSFRLLRIGKWWRDYDRSLTTSMFHANPWSHVRIEPSSGALVYCANKCPTPDSLFTLADPDFLVSEFEDDLIVQFLVAGKTGDFGFLREQAELAQTLEVELDLGEGARASADRLYDAMAFHATTSIMVDLSRELVEKGKRLLVMLSYPQETIAGALRDGGRPDEAFVRGLEKHGIPVTDVLEAHRADYRAFAISADDYVDRLFIGHYTPAGNHFFAFSVKDAVVSWLDPPPPAYRDREASFARQAARLA